MIYKLPNAAGSTVEVTTTATLLEDLIDTAASSASNFRPDLNMVMIVPEDGDIRYLADDNTPTSTNGVLLSQDTLTVLNGMAIDKLRLISTTGGNVTTSVQVGKV